MSIWDDWLEQRTVKKQVEQGEPAKPPAKEREAIKRRVTEDELSKLQRLQKITPQQASMDKRFIRNFGGADAFTEITERQAWYIEVLWYKYRKQLGVNPPKPVGYYGRGPTLPEK